jgi:hypothetical protein
MSTPSRQGLTARIRQIRRTLPLAETSPEVPGTGPAPVSVQALEARIADLEKLVQGLQDSVYRESQRVDKRIEELEARVDPTALAAALSQNARERGL